jgi:nucleoside phosphorylase
MVMATTLEAKPFIDGLSLIRESEKPFPVYKNNNYTLIISGIGKANAAMACAYSCLTFPNCRIINLGAAGATDANNPLGKTFHITEAIEFDRPHWKSKTPYVHKPDFFEGFPCAKIATSDHPVIDLEERKKISLMAELVDMESASVIQTCKKFDTQCYLFKFVSDTPDHTNDTDIVDNIKKYRDDFFVFFRQSVIPLL